MDFPRSNRPDAADPGARTLVLGVLGGIAAGKSEVARLLAGDRGRVIDADRLAHAALSTPEVRERVRARFGDGVLDASGEVDRAALAQRVFDDPRGRSELESWIHPRVRESIQRELAAARVQGVPRVVLDVPLLLENDAQHHLVGQCDALVFVDTPEPLRAARARASRGWTGDELRRRERVQMDPAQKRARADHVVSNARGQAELRAAVEQVLHDLYAARDAG